MKPYQEMRQKLGQLKIHNQRAQKAILNNDITGMETESDNIEVLLIEVLRLRTKLSKDKQKKIRQVFIAIREETLQTLELLRRVLDDSMKMLFELIDTIEESEMIKIS